MYEDTEKFVDLDFEQQVRQAAYHLWEDDGRPFGDEKKYWFLALEHLLRQRTNDGEKRSDPIISNEQRLK